MGKRHITDTVTSMLFVSCAFYPSFFPTEQSSPPPLTGDNSEKQNKVRIIIIFVVLENNTLGNKALWALFGYPCLL